MKIPAFVPSTAAPLQDGDMLAAIDLGSNSFHLVVARYTLGQLRTVDRVRETVRLAEGLDGKGTPTPAVRQRAFECLERLDGRSVVSGKSVTVCVVIGGHRIIQQKKK